MASNAIYLHTATPAPALDQARFVINFPPVFGYEGLAQLLGRAPNSLQADKCRKPESLPPCCTPPGVKSPLWLLEDVICWLEKYRQVAPSATKKKPGRPAKAEQAKAAQMGISVAELRRLTQGEASHA